MSTNFEHLKYFRDLIRFSKENDVYKQTIGILHKYDYSVHIATDFFDRYILWDNDEKGFCFWYEIHLKWYLFLARKYGINRIGIMECTDRCHKEIKDKYQRIYEIEFCNELKNR